MGLPGSAAKARAVLAALLMAALAAPAMAQFSDSYTFIKAVRDRDGSKATELLDKPGTGIVNTRDRNTDETALVIVTKARDISWMAFMLSRGAKTELRDKAGDTALTAATRVGFIEGARLLVSVGAAVNLPDANGETPLILAVQQRDPVMVRYLLTSGADPKIADHVAGKTARDYAQEDRRGTAILRLLDEAKPAGPVSGPPRPSR